LKPILGHVQAFTEAKREVVATIVDFFAWIKAAHQKGLRKPPLWTMKPFTNNGETKSKWLCEPGTMGR
jgi:hypothetical protein